MKLDLADTPSPPKKKVKLSYENKTKFRELNQVFNHHHKSIQMPQT